MQSDGLSLEKEVIMNIYEARELQKKLCKLSCCKFKKMGIVFSVDHDKIAYYVTHHIVPGDSMIVTEEAAQTMAWLSSLGVIVKVDYVSEERKIKDKLVSPVGLYIVELIEID